MDFIIHMVFFSVEIFIKLSIIADSTVDNSVDSVDKLVSYPPLLYTYHKNLVLF